MRVGWGEGRVVSLWGCGKGRVVWLGQGCAVLSKRCESLCLVRAFAGCGG